MMLRSSRDACRSHANNFAAVLADVEESIKSGGLAAIKTERIKVRASHHAQVSIIICYKHRAHLYASCLQGSEANVLTDSLF